MIHSYQPHNVEAYLEAGKIYAKLNKPNSILKVIERLHNFSHPSSESRVLLAKAYLLKAQYAECETTLKEIFEAVRDFPEAVALQAELFTLTGRAETAVEMLQSLNMRFPKEPEYLVLLASAYFSLGKFHWTVHVCSVLRDAGMKDPRIKALLEKAQKLEKRATLGKLRKTKPGKWLLAQMFPFILDTAADCQDKTTKENLVKQTVMDDLTGLLNFRAARNQIPAYAAKKKAKIYLCMADIDYFKSFNDVHSNHQVGNAVLRTLAKAGQGIFSKERIWRYGGEEVIWILDGDEKEALEKAGEFRKYVEEKVVAEANEIIKAENIRHFTDGTGHKKDDLYVIHYPVTISQAIVEWGEDGVNLETLVTAADDGLYGAKATGRNAIVFRGIVHFQGKKPVHYTKELLEVLHQYAAPKGAKDWWEYSAGLSEKAREEVLEYARNTEKGVKPQGM